LQSLLKKFRTPFAIAPRLPGGLLGALAIVVAITTPCSISGVTSVAGTW
jgi:hypothetical protein